MSKINYGGQAFPTHYQERGGAPIDYNDGMTLRDWFAGMAMQGICANPEIVTTPAQRARLAFEVADAMVAASEAVSE